MTNNVTFENIIDNKDIEDMKSLIKIKKDLMTYIGIKNIVDFIKETIENTDNIDFRSENSKKYIDINDPTFVLTKKDLVVDKNNIKNDVYLNELTNEVTDFINKNIIFKLTDFIKENLNKNEELSNIYKQLSEDIRNMAFINTFSIRINPIENIIYLKYLI